MKKNLVLKVVLVLAVIVALPVLGLIFLLLGVSWFFEDVNCFGEILSKEVSPDHTHVAYTYTRNCGPWDDYVYHASILNIGEKPGDEMGNILSTSNEPPKMKWNSSNQLIIEYDPRQYKVHLENKEKKVDGVEVLYQKCIPEKILSQQVSPNDHYVASIFQRSCLDDDLPYHLSLEEKDGELGEVSGDNPVFHSSKPFSVQWDKPGILIIEYDPSGKWVKGPPSVAYIDFVYRPKK